MKFKKEYLILAGVIVALSLYLFLHRTDRTHYELPVVSGISGADITRLEIDGPDATITLTRKDNRWTIDPYGYAADSSKVDRMIDAVGKLTLTALVSEAGSFSRYDLAPDTRIAVKAWTGSSVAREFDIGKTAGTHQHTFVKLPDTKNVYHARGNFHGDFDQSVDDLRDKKVLTFAQADIRKIRIIRGGETMEFIRKDIPTEPAASDTGKEEPDASTAEPVKKTRWETGGGQAANEAAVNALLASLSNLKCNGYISDQPGKDGADPFMTLIFESDREHTLSIFEKTATDDTAHPAVSSQSDEPFTLTSYKVDDVKKQVDELAAAD